MIAAERPVLGGENRGALLASQGLRPLGSGGAEEDGPQQLSIIAPLRASLLLPIPPQRGLAKWSLRVVEKFPQSFFFSAVWMGRLHLSQKVTNSFTSGRVALSAHSAVEHPPRRVALFRFEASPNLHEIQNTTPPSPHPPPISSRRHSLLSLQIGRHTTTAILFQKPIRRKNRRKKNPVVVVVVVVVVVAVVTLRSPIPPAILFGALFAFRFIPTFPPPPSPLLTLFWK